MAVGIFGGAFDPPHNGHVALARTAMERLDLDRLYVTVVVAPGRKETVAPAESRLELARLAFAGLGTVEPELYEYTRRRARGPRLRGSGLPDRRRRARWTSRPGSEPERVLELARLGVATRPGYRRRRRRRESRSSSSSRIRSPRPRYASASAAGSRSRGSCRTQSPGGSSSSVSTGTPDIHLSWLH